VHTLLVADHADPLRDDQLLTAMVPVRPGPGPRAEVDRHRAQLWQLARQLLDPHTVRVVKQVPQLVGNWILVGVCDRIELVHLKAPLRSESGPGGDLQVTASRPADKPGLWNYISVLTRITPMT
jgi:hypothetical protein